MGKALSQILSTATQQQKFQCDMLIPVPMHSERLKERRFNQSELIAQDIHKACDTPIRHDILQRIRHTEPQAGLSAKERKKNLKKAFECSYNFPKNIHVGLVDDVVTTGTTAHSIALLLKKHGAAKVTLLAFARTP